MRTEVARRPGAVVLPGDVPAPATGGWRTGTKPALDRSRCTDCLMCWLYCPDGAAQQVGGRFQGFAYEVCKGCGICAAVCAAGAVAMVDEHA
jgi:2-oxoacid:acceptor oxidoreductase delta subunit (pyruvate/2-ketoisovalerate family)